MKLIFNTLLGSFNQVLVTPVGGNQNVLCSIGVVSIITLAKQIVTPLKKRLSYMYCT